MKTLGIIPARYASTRFPGKPLALLGGRPVIEHVYERARHCTDELLVATDDARIARAVETFGGNVAMTGTHHVSGTSRCLEAYEKFGKAFDVIINIQGDEPFVRADQLEQLKNCFDTDEVQIATLAHAFAPHTSWSELSDPNVVKVVMNRRGEALYFSRSVIPYVRGSEPAQWAAQTPFYRHVGIYAYRVEVLRHIAQMAPGRLHSAESLEQLSWLEAGYTIRVALTDYLNIGIDTPADLAEAQRWLNQEDR